MLPISHPRVRGRPEAILGIDRAPRAEGGLPRPPREAVFWALLIAIATTIAGCATQPLGDAARASHAAQLLSRAIAIATVNPPGNEAALAEFLVQQLRRANIQARVIETPTGSSSAHGAPTPRRAAAWARLAGSGRARPIVLLSHLDVVSANAAEWKWDPFEGRVEAGFVHGRGALDAKSVGIVHLLTLLELARRDIPLDRDVIFLATPDEESGGALGAGHLVREHADLLANAEFLLTEGGGVRIGQVGQPSVWGVTVTEKSPCWLELTARGTPGHTSTPARDAAVPRLIAALDAVRRLETPIRVVPEVARMFRALAPTATAEDREGYLDLRRALETDAAFRHRFSSSTRVALVRNTVSITVLEGAPRTNVAPAFARGQLDARLLPGERCADFVRTIRAAVDDDMVSIRELLALPSVSSSIDTDLYRAIERVAQRSEPEAIVVPRVITGFTDAHYFREAGILAYGFVPRWLAVEDTHGIHGPNEKISIDNLTRGTETLVAILEELAAP